MISSDDTDDQLMRYAISLSRKKMDEGHGGPFGAIIARDGVVIAEGFNQVTSTNDPTAHAEVMAIRYACQTVASFSLDDCTIYTSCEPCPMCLAAIYWARIKRIVFANNREDAAAIGFDDQFLYNEIGLPLSGRSVPADRILANEALEVFKAWSAKTDKVPY